LKLVAHCFTCEKDEEIVEFYPASGIVKFKCGATSRVGAIKVIAE